MKLASLITLVSEVTGEAHGVVRVKARALREAGMISQGGRGTAGADMTARDVARILLSLLSSQSTTTDRALVELESARIWHVKWSGADGWSNSAAAINGQFPERLPPALRDMGAGQSVTDALAHLLAIRADILTLSIEGTQDGQAVTLAFRGEAEHPEDEGMTRFDWYLDFAVPSPSKSRIRVLREVDGSLVNDIGAAALHGEG